MDGPILVTGGAGFVGSHVVDALLARGVAVRAVDALLPAAHGERPEYLHPDAEWIDGDLRDPELAGRCVRGVRAVCHQAAMVGLGTDIADIADYVGHNDLATAVLLRALAATGFAGRIVLASSMVVYGEGRYACAEHGAVRPGPRAPADLDAGRFEPPCPVCGRALAPRAVPEDAPPDPRNVYAATKLAQEHLCAAFSRETGVPVTALRYHNVYGPRMPRDTPYAGVASIFRSSLEAGEPPRVFEDGAQRRDFVHVRDVARANVAGARRRRPRRERSTSAAARRGRWGRWPGRWPGPTPVAWSRWSPGRGGPATSATCSRPPSGRRTGSGSPPPRTSRPGCGSSRPRRCARRPGRCAEPGACPGQGRTWGGGFLPAAPRPTPG